jgi:hypothetical protein
MSIKETVIFRSFDRLPKSKAENWHHAGLALADAFDLGRVEGIKAVGVTAMVQSLPNSSRATLGLPGVPHGRLAHHTESATERHHD